MTSLARITWTIFVITTALFVITDAMPQPQPQVQQREYCEDETFGPSCASDEVVVMKQALYGRMATGKCVPAEYSMDLGCSADVLPYMDVQCSGRRACSVPVRDLIAKGLGNCPPALRSYLLVSYTCLKVVLPGETRCYGPSAGTLVTVQGEGYVSSYVTQQTSCGTTESPWLLRAKAGQKINVSLIDFTSLSLGMSSSGGSGTSGASDVCVVYATIRDGNGQLTQTVCGGIGKRLSHVFTSVSNSLEVRLVGKLQQSKAEGYFLLKYAVEGCADPDLPEGAWLKRDGSGAQISCKANPQTTWMLKCVRGAWEGEAGVCLLEASAAASRDGNDVKSAASMPYSESIVTRDLAIILISSIAIFVAIAIFVMGVLCIKRKYARGKEGLSPMHPGDYTQYSPRDYALPLPPGYVAYTATGTLPYLEQGRPSTLKMMTSYGGQYSADGSTTYTQQPIYRDHVYESPNFDRMVDFANAAAQQPVSDDSRNAAMSPQRYFAPTTGGHGCRH